MDARTAIVPPLDPGFVPAALWNRAYRARCERESAARPLALALERTDGTVSRFETHILPHTGANLPLNRKYVERLVKFLLWARGGWRVIVGGDPVLAGMLSDIYSAVGERRFDVEFMGSKVYGRELLVEARALED